VFFQREEIAMHKYVWVLCLVGLLGPACAQKVDVEQQKAALMEADKAWAQTTTDSVAIMSYFAPDAMFEPPGMPVVVGVDAIRPAIAGFMAMPGFSLTWEAAKADVAASGDLGYTVGSYTLTVNDATGAPAIEKGKYVTVWKKQADGKWKVEQDIFNADAPPPASPPATPEAKK
jgi:ketosteroid isomerase-like protein